MWCVADLNEEYISKMEDVLETYERPYDANQPVVCLDEKPVTLHADVRPASPAAPGREARRDNEYERCGTANVFCAVEPKAGRHFTFPTPDRSGFEFAQVLFHLALKYPKAETIHLVMDNLNSHRRKSLSDLYGAEMASQLWDCFTIHYTPTHGSWLNQAEIEIGIFARQCLGSRRIPDLKTLRREVRAWNRRMNRDRVKINWKFDRKAARRKFGYKGNPSRGQRPSTRRCAIIGHLSGILAREGVAQCSWKWHWKTTSFWTSSVRSVWPPGPMTRSRRFH
jgi:hypothetical protein